MRLVHTVHKSRVLVDVILRGAIHGIFVGTFQSHSPVVVDERTTYGGACEARIEFTPASTYTATIDAERFADVF
jgi:hypothetical protein